MAALFLITIAVVTAVVRDVSGQCLSDQTCSGHGTCQTPCTSSTCDCTGDYSGRFCDIPPDCTLNGGECGAHGRCTKALQCNCSDYYWGSYCQIAPVCTPNGGECGTYGECNTCGTSAYGVGKYPRSTCQCNSGYGGKYCEKAPLCTKGGNECKTGEECDFTLSPYNCTCLRGYELLGEPCGASHMVIVIPSLFLTLLGSFMMTEY